MQKLHGMVHHKVMLMILALSLDKHEKKNLAKLQKLSKTQKIQHFKTIGDIEATTKSGKIF